MEQLTVKIDISTHRGRKLVRELHGQKGVEIENPISPEIAGQKMYTLEESYNECINILSKNYGVDVSKL